jgi:hypothetical protein
MTDIHGTLSTLEDHQLLWDKIQHRRAFLEAARIAPPDIRLWDGDMNLRGTVAGWRSIDFEFIENDTGNATLQLSLSHYLAKWVMNYRGRSKRNVIITIDKQGTRWSGFMSHYRVVREKGGDAYLEIVFVHDYEQAKHILCWANPFLLAAIQFPKLWIIFGPAKWCLLLTLFVNILRLETSIWTLPDNPLDITEFHDVAQKTLRDAQLTVVSRRYLDGDPHPFSELAGELDIDFVEELFSLIPIRHGALVWDIEDNSGWGTETAFGGSLLTGLIRAVVNIASDGTTEGIDVFTGDPTYPGEYYTPNFLGTSPTSPWVVFEEGPYTGIESSEFKYYEATTTSFVTGGHSMPGVNEAISAGVNMAGDFVTSLINSALAAGGAFGTAIDLPPLGGVMDAVAQLLYKDVFLAFMEIPTLRAATIGELLQLVGLEDNPTSLGDFHFFEDWCDGADKGYTLSALMAVRAKMWATRAHTAHTIKVSDAAPYLVGERGYGHFWLGDRVGTTVLEYPIPFTIFVERLSKIRYTWDKDGPKGWQLTIGYREPEDPALKALDWIREINAGLGDLGVL